MQISMNRAVDAASGRTFVEIAGAILSEIDWAALIKRLTAYALMLARAMPAVFDGVSPEDFVSEAVLSYFRSDNGLNWNPNEGSLERFLCGVVKNNFLMHARRNRQYAGILDHGLDEAKNHMSDRWIRLVSDAAEPAVRTAHAFTRVL